MSLSPESFEHLLAQKLAQVPEPDYDPAHWDHLEDQLQHLNQALQHQQAPAPSTSPAPPAPSVGAGWLAGPMAKIGFVAALAGLTATNAWLILHTSQPVAVPVVMPTAPSTTAPVTQMALPEKIAPADAATSPALVTTLPATSSAVGPVRDRKATTTTLLSAKKTSDSSAPAVVAPVSAPVALMPPPAAVSPGAMASEPTIVVENDRPAVVQPTRTDTVRAPTPAAGTSEAVASFERLSHDIANIITPQDRDGRNDRFELPFAAGTYRLTIYDNKNRVVYDRAHYDNSWDATGLPAGVYVYTVRPDAAPQWHLSGTVTVQR